MKEPDCSDAHGCTRPGQGWCRSGVSTLTWIFSPCEMGAPQGSGIGRVGLCSDVQRGVRGVHVSWEGLSQQDLFSHMGLLTSLLPISDIRISAYRSSDSPVLRASSVLL